MTRNLWRIFLWQALRDLRRHPLLGALNVFSVGLGIAVYLAIQIANQGASRSFAATVDFVAGKAQLEVRGDLDEALWPSLARQPGIAAATPLLEGIVTLPDHLGEYLRVVGMDLFSSERFRTFSPADRHGEWNIERWLGEPGVIALMASNARSLGLQPGDHLRATVNGEIKVLSVLTLIDANALPAAADSRFALIDIGWAQELFGQPGKLSAVQLMLSEPGKAAEVSVALASTLPSNLRAEAPRQRSFQLQHMVSAFQLNLTALSLVSLLVGVFLIFNTVAAAVTRRRREIGILRAIGATRPEIRILFLAEAGLLGVIGIFVGCVGGVGLAQFLSATVARTISSLYVLVRVDPSWPSVWQLASSCCLGLLAVFVGAWLPASEAAAVDPIAALSHGAHLEARETRSFSRIWAAALVLLFSAAAAGYSLEDGPPAFAFVAAFGVLVTAAFLAPGATLWFSKTVAGFATGAEVPWRMAAHNLGRSVHRNSMTVAALSSAIALLTGLTVMIFSFRQSVADWINRGVVADLLISPAANEETGRWATIPPKAISWILNRPEVASVDTLREQSVEVVTGPSSKSSPAVLLAIGGVFRHNLRFKGGQDDAKAAKVFGGDEVAVTESFARRFKVWEGGAISILTSHGSATFKVAGVYTDYSQDQGMIVIDRRNFDRFWDEAGVHSLAIFLKPGMQSDQISDAFRREFGREGEFAIYSNRALRQRVLAVFDETFAITSILRMVALIVAVAGVYLSVITLVTEREREIGMLRAIGASRGQIHGILMAESAAVSFVATILGLASGAALAILLIYVVNPAFFGWTIALAVPWAALLGTPAWMIVAAAGAAWHPARKATRANIAVSIREE